MLRYQKKPTKTEAVLSLSEDGVRITEGSNVRNVLANLYSSQKISHLYPLNSFQMWTRRYRLLVNRPYPITICIPSKDGDIRLMSTALQVEL
jgi:hypothetical protein